MTSTAWRTLAVFLVLSAGATDDALACSCMAIGPPCQATWTADAVFAGTVRSIDRIDHTEASGQASTLELVRFDVDRAFVNVPTGSVAVVTNPMSTCHYRFQTGKTYLVYATKTETARLSTSICSRTRLLTEAQEDLRYLTSMPAAGIGGRVYGRVTEWKRDPAEAIAVDYGPVEHVTVSVRGSTFVRDVVTDADGRFEVPNLPTGKATVTVFPPSGFETRYLERQIEVRDLRACSEADFTLSQIATAAGTVVDGSGRPVAGVEVDAVAAELAGFDPPPFQQPVKTDARGGFEFDDLPPGTYVFGVNLTKRPGARQAGKPVFLPGTALAREATAIELKPGDRKEIGVLRLAR